MCRAAMTDACSCSLTAAGGGGAGGPVGRVHHTGPIHRGSRRRQPLCCAAPPSLSTPPFPPVLPVPVPVLVPAPAPVLVLALRFDCAPLRAMSSSHTPVRRFLSVLVGAAHRQRDACDSDRPRARALPAVGETFILLHPPLPLVGVSIWTERGCQ